MNITVKELKDLNACGNAIFQFEKMKIKSIEVKNLFKILMKKPFEISVKNRKENKLKWANWLIARLLIKLDRVRYAVFAAEQVINIFEKKYPNDNRPRMAIEAAKNYINNPTAADAYAAAAAYADAYAAAAAAADAYAAAYAAAYAYAAAAAAAYAYAAAAADADAAAAAAAAAYAAAYAAASASAYASAYASADKMRIKILKYGISLIRS
jgi:hypothetical protein